MNEQQKSGANSPSSTTGNASQATGSGSDTVSAAKISAGTSVGNVGQSPMPQSGSGAGSSGGTSAQSATLASHTSKPMGGTGGTGASNTQASSGSGGGQGGQGGQSRGGQSSGAQSSGASDGGIMDQAKQTAGQASSAASEMYDQAAEWARDTYEQASDWASGAYGEGSRHANRVGGRSVRGMRNAGSGVQRYVAENPVMVGLIGLATGLLIGALLPRTRHEDEAFGEWADEVREQGLRYAHEMAQRGREFVEESFSGDDPRFAQHESELRSGGRGSPNRH